MSNLDEYARTFQSLWVGLRKQRTDYEAKVEKLQRYKGSKGFDDEMAEAKKAYDDGVLALHQQEGAKLNRLLKAMSEKVPAEKMDVPTDEQVRLLQTLAMRDKLTTRDIELAAESLKNSDTAMATLSDLARKSGLMVGANHKSAEAQRREAHEELRQAATAILSWDGADGHTVRIEHLKARRPYAGGDPATAKKHQYAAAWCADMGGADMQGMKYEKSVYEMVRLMVRDSVPWSAIEALG